MIRLPLIDDCTASKFCVNEERMLKCGRDSWRLISSERNVVLGTEIRICFDLGVASSEPVSPSVASDDEGSGQWGFMVSYNHALPTVSLKGMNTEDIHARCLLGVGVDALPALPLP